MSPTRRIFKGKRLRSATFSLVSFPEIDAIWLAKRAPWYTSSLPLVNGGLEVLLSSPALTRGRGRLPPTEVRTRRGGRPTPLSAAPPGYPRGGRDRRVQT